MSRDVMIACEHGAKLMKRLRRVFRCVLGALIAGPIVLTLILQIAPTGWARRRIEAELSRLTGCKATLGGFQFGILGEIRLTDLEIVDFDPGSIPWTHLDRASIHICLADLVRGRFDPYKVEIDGFLVRLERRSDGTCRLSDIIERYYSRSPDSVDESRKAFDRKKRAVAIRLNKARLIVSDQTSDTKFELTDISGRGTWSAYHAELNELTGRLNDGVIRMAARLDSDGPEPTYEFLLRMREVKLNRGLTVLRYFTPILPTAPDRLGSHGLVKLRLDLRGQGLSIEDINRSLVGHGMIAIEPITIDDTMALARVVDAVGVDHADRIGSIDGSFVIGRGLIHTDNTTLKIGKVPLTFQGWTSFGGQIDYRLADQTRALFDKIPRELRDLMNDWSIDIKRLTSLRVRGSIERPDVEIDGKSLLVDPTPTTDRRDRLRQIGRRLQDQIIR